ncbi:MAG: hypothetical protein IM606_03585 [Cytophagales bacterium]|nr:hypothetical protein [Cytophagales bacterium]MCA6388839.1 hypothetical protein [Cytophagales bacterium]MCA6390724.1 hypothetical protein [Cytophagales bacterium]MCA6394251.1 hypothetical protein [Cytophagales bacterium]MCA6398197.1 hypothetical protein [Cytophagales bacterium]
MKTKILFFAISLLVFSCTQEKGLQPQNSVQIVKASANFVSNFVSFSKEIKSTSFSESRDSKFDISNFDSSNLSELKLSLNGKVASQFGIQSSTNPALVMIINFDENKNVKGVSISETVKSSIGFEVKVFDLDGNLRKHFLADHKNKTITEFPIDFKGGRASGWWQDSGDCISTVMQPFSNGWANLAFDLAAGAATGGWYYVVVAGACSIRAAMM